MATQQRARQWDGILRGLMRSGEIVTVGPNGMTGMRSVVGIEARRFPIWMNAQILMPGERRRRIEIYAARHASSARRRKTLSSSVVAEAYPMERGDVVISPAWTFHDHWNKDATPAIWIDGYDNGYNPNVNINERMPNDEPYEEIKKPAAYGRRTSVWRGRSQTIRRSHCRRCAILGRTPTASDRAQRKPRGRSL